MDDIDAETIGIALFVDLIVSLVITFLFVLFTLPPDDAYLCHHHYIRGVGRSRVPLLAVPYSRMDRQRIDVDPRQDRTKGVNDD